MNRIALLSLLACGALAAALPGARPALAALGGDDEPSVASHARPANAYEAEPFTDHSVGEMKEYRTKYEDTLVQVARDNKLGFVELRSANPYVDPWLPGDGTKMILPTMHLLPRAPHSDIVINLPDFRLYAYLRKDAGPYNFPIGVGRDGLNTPMGSTQIVRKVVGPVWRPTPRMRREKPELPAAVGPGIDNPMDTHAMYLGWPQYAIHGTNKPFGIGRRTSSGCIRMYPEDIITLYNMVPVGTKVTVVNQPVKAAWVGNTFYIEAHASLAQADKLEQEGGLPDYELTDQDMALIIAAAGDQVDNLDWKKIRKLIRDRQGYPIAVAARSAHVAATAADKTAAAAPRPGLEDDAVMSPMDIKKPDASAPRAEAGDTGDAPKAGKEADAAAQAAEPDSPRRQEAMRHGAPLPIAEKQDAEKQDAKKQGAARQGNAPETGAKRASRADEKAAPAAVAPARFNRDDDDRSEAAGIRSSQENVTPAEAPVSRMKDRPHNS
jgi:L,D-transpeptidase ErfK/SrfK